MRGPRVKPIIIAAGGTGGHLFPAEALAAALLKRGERVVLMTDARSAAAQLSVFAGCEIHVIAGAGIAGRSPRRAMAGAAAIAAGIWAARRVMAALHPAAIAGFGGYPSVAPILAARTLRHRPAIILHDQNAALGKANQFLARFADSIATSFPSTTGLPSGRAGDFTGNPVRPAIAALAAAPYTPPGDTINLLVLGGSLGARIFATLIPTALARLPAALRARVNLTMQCPESVLESAKASLENSGITATLSPFFNNVAERLAAADLVIARAGGSTVAELAVIGRPAILIPLTINDDQRANATALATAGGAVCIEQSAGEAALAAALEALLANPAQRTAMANAAARLGIVNAAETLADLVQRQKTTEPAA